MLAYAITPQAQAANCNASNVGTLDNCLAISSLGDTITLTASITIPNGGLAPVAGGLATQPVTLINNGFALLGGGTFNKNGPGTLALLGPNGLLGDTTIGESILMIATGQALGGGNITITGVGGSASTLFTIGNVNLTNNSIIMNGVAPATLVAGTGGTLIFTGSNGVVVGAGATAQFGDGVNTGAIVLAPTGGSTATATSSVEVLSGTLKAGNSQLGQLTSTAGTTFVNTGAKLDLNGFDTTINRLAGSGTVETGGNPAMNLTVNYSSVATNFDGTIQGSGNLIKTGAGTMILRGTNTYTGTTTISGGNLELGDSTLNGTLGTGNVINNSTLAIQGPNSQTISNAISGTGNLVVLSGGGGSTLTGDNTYSGGTTIQGGATLTVGNGGTSGSLGTGNISNNGTLVFARSDTLALFQTITGGGGIAVNSGVMSLAGANNYAGGNDINSGATLLIDGLTTAAGFTLAHNGGTLGGSGLLFGSAKVESGGTLGAGVFSNGAFQPGTGLNVNGTLSFATGSNFVVPVTPTAAGTVSTSGNIFISGGTVNVQAANGTYAPGTNYNILTTAGTINGTFDGVTSNLAFLTPTLTYTANTVNLGLTQLAFNNPAVTSGGLTVNQNSVANYLTTLQGTSGTALQTQLNQLSVDQARSAFDSLSGSQHIAATQVAMALDRNFSRMVMDRAAAGGGIGLDGVRYGTAFSPLTSPLGQIGDLPYQVAGGTTATGWNPASQGPVRDTGMAASGSGSVWGPARQGLHAPGESGVWGQALGTGGRARSDGNGESWSYRAGGFMAGYDHAITNNWLIGGTLGYNRANWDANANGAAPANGRVESPMGALYARFATGPWQVRLNSTFADHAITTHRDIAIGNALSTADSSHHAREYGIAAEAEYALQAGAWQVRPLAGLRYARLREDGFAESGNSVGALTVDGHSSDSTQLSAGAKLVRPFNGGDAGLELRAVASHAFGDVDTPISSRLGGQANSFTTLGTPLKRDALTLGTSLTARIGQRFSGYADLALEERGSGQSAFALSAGVRYLW